MTRYRPAFVSARAAPLGLAAALLSATSVPARAESLTIALASHQIAVRGNYTGQDVTLFGVVERDGATGARPEGFDIVVTVRGPRDNIVVREREPFGPFWLNRSQQKYTGVATFLGVLSTRPIDDVAAPELQRRRSIGLPSLIEPSLPGADPRFHLALLRLRQNEGTIAIEERGVTFLTPSLFRASLSLPATAPLGDYAVDVALFSGGALLARQQTNFEVVKRGFERVASQAAAQVPLAYGLVVAASSVLLGWLASLAARRD